jgi:hypothetical protein
MQSGRVSDANKDCTASLGLSMPSKSLQHNRLAVPGKLSV